MNKLLIISDISKDSGLGHWMRCYNLADALHQNGYEIHALQSPLMKTFDLFMPTDFIHWHESQSTLHHSNSLELIKKLQQIHAFTAILIDGYRFTESYRQALQATVPFVIAFDDINDCPSYHCDVLVNSSPKAMKYDYSTSAKEAMLLLGPGYRQMARGYLHSREQLLANSNWDSRDAVTIMMGGADTHSLTLPLLQTLAQLDWQDGLPPINVITTNLYSNTAMIHNWCAQHKKINVYHQQYDLSEIFMSSRLVVSAAGGSTYEIQLCAAPAFTIIVEDNQQEASNEAEHNGWSLSWDWRDKKDMTQLGNSIAALWENTRKIKAMHNKLIFDLDKARIPDLASHLNRVITKSGCE